MRYLPTAYKIGLLAAIAISLGIFIGALHQADLKRQDAKTEETFTKVNDKVYAFASDKQFVPGSLAAAGIHAPSNITYKKVSEDTYKLCTVYKSSYLISYHKGQNCQSSQLYFTAPKSQSQPFVKNSDGSYTVCGVHTNYFDGEGHVLQGPPATPGSISISSNSYPYVGSRLLFMISQASREFDEKCNSLTPADLTTGSTVAVFDITSPDAAATSIFLKRSY